MKKRRLNLHDVKSELSNTHINYKEDKKATTLNSMTDLADIDNNAYSVVCIEEETADRLLLSNIRKQAQWDERILVFCIGSEAKAKAIKYSPASTGEVTIISLDSAEYLFHEVELITNYIADIKSFNTIYVLGYEEDCDNASYFMQELNELAGKIEVPIFVSINSFDGRSNIPVRVFILEPMPEFLNDWEMIAFYSLAYSEANHRRILAYDLFSNTFADIENPFSEEREEEDFYEFFA